MIHFDDNVFCYGHLKTTPKSTGYRALVYLIKGKFRLVLECLTNIARILAQVEETEHSGDTRPRCGRAYAHPGNQL